MGLISRVSSRTYRINFNAQNMAQTGATVRLRKDYLAIKRSPVPFVLAEPDPANMLHWHYIIIGPPDTPYENGTYHGILKFPKDFPFKPPSILMYTPSGRFKPSTRICLSMSDYHPESWNPSWNVSSILTGLVSFMVTDDNALGTMSDSAENRRSLARSSFEWNTKINCNTTSGRKFMALFEDYVKEQMEKRSRESQERFDNLREEVSQAQSESQCSSQGGAGDAESSVVNNKDDKNVVDLTKTVNQTKKLSAKNPLSILLALLVEAIGPINWGSVATFLFVAAFAYVASYILGTVE